MPLIPFFSRKPPEAKASAAKSVIALHRLGGPAWAPRDYASLARNGFEKNVIAYRCVRLVAEAASAAPLKVSEHGSVMSDHPLIELFACPNPEQSGAELFESFYGFLQTAGNAYLEAVRLDEGPRELYALRPDRMKAIPGASGWPEAYEYAAGGRKVMFRRDDKRRSPVLHLKLFHPTNDHYGFSPLEAAAAPVDVHSAASAWNKALLDNAARPSGALIYKGPEGAENLTAEQFDRLKVELENAYQGSSNAGRPLVLDGGLEWRSMALTPCRYGFH